MHKNGGFFSEKQPKIKDLHSYTVYKRAPVHMDRAAFERTLSRPFPCASARRPSSARPRATSRPRATAFQSIAIAPADHKSSTRTPGTLWAVQRGARACVSGGGGGAGELARFPGVQRTQEAIDPPTGRLGNWEKVWSQPMGKQAAERVIEDIFGLTWISVLRSVFGVAVDHRSGESPQSPHWCVLSQYAGALIHSPPLATNQADLSDRPPGGDQR